MTRLTNLIKEVLRTPLHESEERFKVIDTKTGEVIDNDLPKKLAQKLAAKKKEWYPYPDKKESTIAKIARTLDESKKKDCNCGCGGCSKPTSKGVMLNESVAPKQILSENLQYHVQNKLPLTENTFRYGSESFLNLWQEARYLYLREIIHVNDDDKEILEETDLGNYGMYEGKKVPLGLPMENTVNESEDLDEAAKKKKKKNPPIGKPKRGGPKAYYVYVRDPKTKRIKKVTFGSGGLRAKINNPKARRAFAARHRCAQAKDRTTARYWSCRLPRYAKQLGLSVKNPGGFW